MGDRTFSADDVLRIYEFYLDEREMKTVEDFFAVEPEPEDLTSTQSLLDTVIGLLEVLPQFPTVFLGSFLQERLRRLLQRLGQLRRTLEAILGL
mgnify:CR=1 FL=1